MSKKVGIKFGIILIYLPRKEGISLTFKNDTRLDVLKGNWMSWIKIWIFSPKIFLRKIWSYLIVFNPVFLKVRPILEERSILIRKCPTSKSCEKFQIRSFRPRKPTALKARLTQTILFYKQADVNHVTRLVYTYK